MALSEEQRVMLQLLLERGQSYEDLASMLGTDAAEVRERARTALREIGGEDPDRDAGLTDYLLGQADPIARADVARHLGSDPAAHALAGKLEAQLRLLAPGAELPSLPRAPRPAQKEGVRADAAAARKGAVVPGSLSGRQRRLIAALLAGLGVVAVLVLVVAGVFDGGGGSTSTAADNGSGASEGGAAATTATGGDVTKAVLRPVGGSDGRGVALFARVKTVPVLQVTTVGLDPLADGQTYYVWLYKSDNLALRIGGFVVDRKGRAVTQLQVPTEAVALVANKTFDHIDVTLTADADYRAALDEAREQNTLPALTGTSVLRGEITGPLVGSIKQTGSAGSGAGGSGDQGG
ncbi:MAG: hypothetical protein ACXWZM_10215 [Solirubrobacterales bacterium]